jgi:hypothetical protein
MMVIRSFILGSAAALVAAVGAQAADLPVKAKAVEYASEYGVVRTFLQGNFQFTTQGNKTCSRPHRVRAPIPAC